MLHRHLLAVAAALLLPSLVSADQADLDAQLLEPGFAPFGLISSSGARPGQQWSVRAGVVLQYERAPLVLLKGTDEIDRVISDRLGMWTGGFIALHERVGVGLAVPLYLQWGSFGGRSALPVAPGDLRADFVVKVLDKGPIAAAVDLRLQLPTSAPGNFVGERRPRVTPGFTFDIGPPRAGAVLGLQLLFRERVITDYDLELHHEFALLVGGRVAIVPGRLAAFGEFSLRATMRHETSGEGQTPVDVRLGVRGHPVPQLAVDLAVGAGLTSGYGTARVRVLLGITAVGLPDHPRRSRPEVAKRPDGPLPESEREAGPSPPPPEPIDLLSDEDMPNLPELDPCAPDRRQVFLYDSFEADPDAPAVVVEVDDSAPTEAGTTWGWHIGGGREAAGQDPLAELRAGEDRIRIREPIPFEYDSDVLLPEAFPLLDAVRHILEQRPDIGLLVIEGHASSEGTVAYNWDLSNRRATSVFRYLVEAGVNPYRLAWRGMGEAVPRTDGEEVTGDRRVEFRIETWLEPDAIPDWRDAPPVPWKELHP